MKQRIGIVALAIAALGLVMAPTAGATTENVGALTVNGWFGFNEGPNGSVGTTQLVPGPGTPPAGAGSAKLTVDSTGRASLGTNAYRGTKLSQITALNFWFYQATSAGNGYPVLQFDIDYNLNDGNTAFQGRLSSLHGAAPLNTWTNVNALTGTWYATGAPGNGPCGQATPCTTAQVLSAFPNAGIRNDPTAKGALLLRLGGPIASGATVYADNLTITRPSGTTTTNFEPGASVTPSIGPGGTAVVIKAYGYKPNAAVQVKFDRLTPRPRRAKLCKVRADASGTATCVKNIPISPGPVGVHPISIKGRGASGSKLVYSIDFVVSP
jgi:hypothetical protein